MDTLGHTLDLDASTVSTEHPVDDVEGCGFDEYVDRDWSGENAPRPSRWEFIRRADDETGKVEWLGTRLDKTYMEESSP